MVGRNLAYAVAVLVAAVAGSIAMTALQRHVPVVPGEQGCVRLKTTVAQRDCLSSVMRDRIADATDALGGGGGDRERAQMVERLVGELDERVVDEPAIGVNCHQAMHVVGRADGERAARRGFVPDFPANSTNLCTAGYVHGLAEGYVTKAGQPAVATVFPQLCHDSDAAPGCAHGLGHALVSRDAQAAGDRSLAPQLAACDTLPPAHVGDCANGVFMELAMRSEVSPAQYTSLCVAQHGMPQESCFGYVPLSALTADQPLGSIPALCRGAALPAAARSCMDGWGRGLGVRGVARCDGAWSPDLARACIRGAVGLQVASGHVLARAASSACRKLDASALQSACVAEVERAAASAKTPG